MTDSEKLIEEARRAYLDAWAATNLEDTPPGSRSRNGIIAALAVFEERPCEPTGARVEVAARVLFGATVDSMLMARELAYIALRAASAVTDQGENR